MYVDVKVPLPDRWRKKQMSVPRGTLTILETKIEYKASEFVDKTNWLKVEEKEKFAKAGPGFGSKASRRALATIYDTVRYRKQIEKEDKFSDEVLAREAERLGLTATEVADGEGKAPEGLGASTTLSRSRLRRARGVSAKGPWVDEEDEAEVDERRSRIAAKGGRTPVRVGGG